MVAVLEIHMERNMVVIMKPSMSLAWLVPTIIIILRATLEDVEGREVSEDDISVSPVVEAAVLHRYGHDESPEEHVVGGVEIVDGHLSRGHDPQHWQQDHREHRGHWEGQGLCKPVGGHE